MTFEEWYSMQRHQLTNEQVCRVIWNAATAAEREACAKVCDEKSDGLRKISESPLMTETGKDLHYTMHVASMNCAAAIRARK